MKLLRFKDKIKIFQNANKWKEQNISFVFCKATLSSVKWGHLGHFDFELYKHHFPTNPMGSSGTLWARLYNNNYKKQNKN